MTDKLLAVIAINLTIITGILVLQNVPNAQAQSDSIQKIAICDPSNRSCVGVTLNRLMIDN